MAITIARNGNLQHTALIFCITAVFLNKNPIDQDQKVFLQIEVREINKTFALKVSLWFPPSVDWKVSRDLAVSDIRPISDRGAGVHDWSVPDCRARATESHCLRSLDGIAADWTDPVMWLDQNRPNHHSPYIIPSHQSKVQQSTTKYN